MGWRRTAHAATAEQLGAETVFTDTDQVPTNSYDLVFDTAGVADQLGRALTTSGQYAWVTDDPAPDLPTQSTHRSTRTGTCSAAWSTRSMRVGSGCRSPPITRSLRFGRPTNGLRRVDWEANLSSSSEALARPSGALAGARSGPADGPWYGLENKVAVVTGSSRGIGRAIVSRLAQAGALVVVHWAHDHAAAEAVVTAINGDGGRVLGAHGLHHSSRPSHAAPRYSPTSSRHCQ